MGFFFFLVREEEEKEVPSASRSRRFGFGARGEMRTLARREGAKRAPSKNLFRAVGRKGKTGPRSAVAVFGGGLSLSASLPFDSTHPNAMDLSSTRSSSLTNVRLRERGVRSPMVTGHDDFVQKGLGLGSRGFSPRYTSRRCTHGMSFGPPTRQLYFSWSNSRSSNVPFAASASTARGGRRRAGEADEGRTRRVARKLDLARRLSEAPSVDAPEERARTRAARASRAGAEAASAARASGAVDIVPSQLRDGATRRRIFWPFLFSFSVTAGESCVLLCCVFSNR